MVNESSPEKTAPQPLYLVQRFVNSVDLEDGDEELSSPEALRDWLAERELMDPGDAVGPADLRRALEAREGLRALMLANSGLPLEADKVEGLDRVASRARVRVSFVAGERPALVTDERGVDGALARLMAIVAAAAEDGSWERMKACRHDTCLWAFYDRSKNRSGKWCRMEACGNVEKARAFRERRRRGGARTSAGSRGGGGS
jgi:predicted RNA-binding Zn ribbon-like protein